jgi:hypothetical protein
MDAYVFPFVWHILLLQEHLQGSSKWVYTVGSNIHVYVQRQEFVNCSLYNVLKHSNIVNLSNKIKLLKHTNAFSWGSRSGDYEGVTLCSLVEVFFRFGEMILRYMPAYPGWTSTRLRWIRSQKIVLFFTLSHRWFFLLYGLTTLSVAHTVYHRMAGCDGWAMNWNWDAVPAFTYH